MGSVCRTCGQTSRDPEFCDYCNGEINGSRKLPPAPSRCPRFASITNGGAVELADAVPLSPAQQAALSRPEASILVNVDGRHQRVHWINREVLPLWTARLRERLAKNSLRCLPEARLAEVEDGAWMIVEVAGTSTDSSAEAGRARTPWAFPVDDPLEECQRLLHYLSALADSIEELHAHGLVLLDFDPRSIEPCEEGRLRFTNLDLGVYPAGQCPERLRVNTRFAAPEIARYQPETIGPRTDVFHLALFAYYWLAGLLPDGFAGEGLEASEYRFPKLRIYAPGLPPGVEAVLKRGLALDPNQRYATPKALVAALDERVAWNRARSAFAGKLRWEIGAQTLTGRTKTALGRDNEDRVLVRTFSPPARALLAVADGITTCAIGSGALASLIATIVLENTFDGVSTPESFTALIGRACAQSAEALLAWAVEKGYLHQLREGADLMGTTLTAGWLEGHTLTLANLGDSRAYLIARCGTPARGQESRVRSQKSEVRTQRSEIRTQEPLTSDLRPLTSDLVVEQLTVDGDLASGMLANGVPPEAVREMGPIGKALRQCIGGCTFTPTGEVTILEECRNPTVTHWSVSPGDTIVLCSDGLVEEGAFLEPATLGEIVAANRHLPAPELARRLVAAADNLHRLPSLLEPDGFGDNISCIVVKLDEER